MDKNSFANERINLALSRATRQSDGNNKKTILINSDLDIDFLRYIIKAPSHDHVIFSFPRR